MSEQKYYVKLKPSISVIVEHDDQDNEIEFGYGYLNGLHEFSPLTPGNTFTKSELAEVMNGDLYRPDTSDLVLDHDLDFFDNLEWINPIIELIPVEEVENV